MGKDENLPPSVTKEDRMRAFVLANPNHPFVRGLQKKISAEAFKRWIKEMRTTGKDGTPLTYEQIGEIVGMTKQAIEQSEKRPVK